MADETDFPDTTYPLPDPTAQMYDGGLLDHPLAVLERDNLRLRHENKLARERIIELHGEIERLKAAMSPILTMNNDI